MKYNNHRHSDCFSVAAAPTLQSSPCCGRFFVGVYRNKPKIGFQGVRSEIHHGSFALEVHGATGAPSLIDYDKL